MGLAKGDWFGLWNGACRDGLVKGMSRDVEIGMSVAGASVSGCWIGEWLLLPERVRVGIGMSVAGKRTGNGVDGGWDSGRWTEMAGIESERFGREMMN